MFRHWKVGIAIALALCVQMACQARAEDWTMWRGPRGDGISLEKDVPLQWSPEKNIRWKTVIPGRGRSSPIVSGDDEPQLIVTGANQTIGLDPATGKRIWFAEGPTEKAVSSPSVGGGYVFSFAGSPSPKGMAIKLGGKGDVSKTHVVWKTEKAMPYVPTPLLVGSLLHIIDDMGIYSCMEPVSGKVLKIARRGGNTYSSPICIQDKIYLFEDSGRCTIIVNDSSFNIVAKNELGEGTQCTPAVAQSSLFVRTDDHLWCIGNQP